MNSSSFLKYKLNNNYTCHHHHHHRPTTAFVLASRLLSRWPRSEDESEDPSSLLSPRLWSVQYTVINYICGVPIILILCHMSYWWYGNMQEILRSSRFIYDDDDDDDDDVINLTRICFLYDWITQKKEPRYRQSVQVV